MPDTDNSLASRVRAANGPVEKALVVWQHYERSKLRTEFEPKWIHAAYEVVREFLDGRLRWDEAAEFVSSHALADGFQDRAGRVVHDGWKVGTSTWVFMGRAAPGAATALGGGWVAVRRTVPGGLAVRNEVRPGWRACWIAYHLEQQMGFTALT